MVYITEPPKSYLAGGTNFKKIHSTKRMLAYCKKFSLLNCQRQKIHDILINLKMDRLLRPSKLEVDPKALWFPTNLQAL